MAQIPEYFAPGADRTIHPNEAGEQALVRAGRFTEERARVTGQAYSQAVGAIARPTKDILDQVERHEEQTDALTGATALSQVNLDFHKQVNDAAQAGDPAAFQKIYDNAQGQRDKFLSQFKTNAGVRHGVDMWDNNARDMERQTMAAASSTQGVLAHKQLETVANNVTQTVGSSLSALPQGHQTLDTAWDAAINSPFTTPEQRPELERERDAQHKEIDRSAFQSAISTPGVNLGALESSIKQGTFKYLDAGQMQSAIKEARHSQEVEARMAASEARMNQIEARENNFAGIMNRGLDPTTGAPSSDLVQQLHSALAKGQITASQYFTGIEGAVRTHEMIGKEADTSKLNPGTFKNIQDGVGLPLSDPKAITPTQIAKAKLDGEITEEQYRDSMRVASAKGEDPQVANTLKFISEDKSIQTGFDQAATRLTAAAGAAASTSFAPGGINLAVKAKTDQFRIDTLKILQNAAINHQDITPLLDPTSQTYLFSQDRVDSYRATKQELQTQLLQKAQKIGAAATTEAKPDLGEILKNALTFTVRPKPATTMQSPGVH